MSEDTGCQVTVQPLRHKDPKERNLSNLVDISRRLAVIREGFHLIIAGSGPCMTEIKKDLEGMPVTFTGFLKGDDLAEAYVL